MKVNIGIDIGKKKCDYCIIDNDGKILNRGVYLNKPALSAIFEPCLDLCTEVMRRPTLQYFHSARRYYGIYAFVHHILHPLESISVEKGRTTYIKGI